MAGAADVVSAGIIVVDHVAAGVPSLPGPGELVLTTDCRLHIGGCAANVAINLARLGICSHVVGSIGEDLLGQFVRQTLEEEGVETGGLVVCPGQSTSQTLVLNVTGQDRRFVHLIGANGLMTASMLPLDRIRAAKVLYLGGLFLLDQLDVAELAGVFQAARDAGVTTILDVVTPGTRDYASELQQVLPQVDYFLPNEDEARLMTGASDPMDQAARLLAWGAANVVITRGARGALLACEKEQWQVGAYTVPFVDGTGGGDAFTAGFIAGLLDDCDIPRLLAIASATGASCVRASGATQGVFRKQQLVDFLQQNRLDIRKVAF